MANGLGGGGGSKAPDIGPVQGVVDSFLAEVRTVELTLKEQVIQLTVDKVMLQGRVFLLEIDLAFKIQALQNAQTRIEQLETELARQPKRDSTDVRAQHNPEKASTYDLEAL